MKNNQFAKILFSIACLYDLILGIGYLFLTEKVYDIFHVELPNHMGYIQFPALLLLIFSLMFYHIVKDPVNNRNLILYSVLMKLAFSVIVIMHWVNDSIPDMWKPFAIADLLFALLFFYAYQKTHKEEGNIF